MDDLCIGFPPVATQNARVLILGSMPGVRSLALQQYYGHPQNRFWPLMAALLGYDSAPTRYEDKLRMLTAHDIALWDVLAACRRHGSLDSAISAEEINPFPQFFAQHPKIHTLCFNGGKARQAYRKHLASFQPPRPLVYAALPSTSPANARWRFDRLRAAWSEALADVIPPRRICALPPVD